MLTPFKLPDLTKCEKDLPVEIFEPIETLFDTITETTITTPSPARVIAKRDVSTYESIIASDLFAKYKQRYSELEAGANYKEKIDSLLRSANKLIVANPKLLYLKQTSSVIIPAIFSLLSARLGRVSDKIAPLLVDDNGKGISWSNILIYEYNDKLLDLAVNRVDTYLDKYGVEVVKAFMPRFKKHLQSGVPYKEAMELSIEEAKNDLDHKMRLVQDSSSHG